MRVGTLAFLSFHTQVFPAKPLALWTLHMSSVDAISSLPLISNKPVIGLAHQLLGMPRGIGEHSMRTGMIYPPQIFATHLLHEHRFADRDAFARFSGIGIGCQRLQATRTLEIIIGPDAPDPVTSELDDDLFDGCYKFDDNDDADP